MLKMAQEFVRKKGEGNNKDVANAVSKRKEEKTTATVVSLSNDSSLTQENTASLTNSAEGKILKLLLYDRLNLYFSIFVLSGKSHILMNRISLLLHLN